MQQHGVDQVANLRCYVSKHVPESTGLFCGPEGLSAHVVSQSLCSSTGTQQKGVLLAQSSSMNSWPTESKTIYSGPCVQSVVIARCADYTANRGPRRPLAFKVQSPKSRMATQYEVERPDICTRHERP